MRKGCTVLLLHGWATDPGVWEGLIEGIDEEARQRGLCLNILAPALPGHGSPAAWREPTLTPALMGLAPLARRQPGPLIGLGWSLGAMALLALAARMPEAFEALVLTGATARFVQGPDFPFGQPRPLVRRMIMDMKRDPGTTLERFYPLNFTERESSTEAAASFLGRYAPPGPLVCQETGGGGGACRRALDYGSLTTALEALAHTDLRETLCSVKTPVLLLHGGLDRVVPPGAAELLGDSLENAWLRDFPEPRILE